MGGGLMGGRRDQIGYSIIDASWRGRFRPPVSPPLKARSIRELATALERDPAALEATGDEFNRAVRPGTFDHTILDNCATAGITPPKTHWARAIDTPPFYGYPLRPGITFTYLGVAIDARARMVMDDGKPAENIFAAGEIMAGNGLGKGYLPGTGTAHRTTFGRHGGGEARRPVRGWAGA